tara:strand:- start:50 stop:472 length:423 start_codon:yes stop_codon:yes gene_type:complete
MSAKIDKRLEREYCDKCDRYYTKAHSKSECDWMINLHEQSKARDENKESLLLIDPDEGVALNKYDKLSQKLKQDLSDDEIRSLFDLRRAVRLLNDDIHNILASGLSYDGLRDILQDYRVINQYVKDFEKWSVLAEEEESK